MQVKTSEYNTLKSQVSSATRKQTGNLAVRDIALLVKPQHLVDSENLTTLFVVVSKFNLKEWETTYEKMCNYVVRPGPACWVCDEAWACLLGTG